MRYRVMLRWATLACALTLVGSARAEGEAPTWAMRYEAARKQLLSGEYRLAEGSFLALTADAPSETDLRLAVEMARLCHAYASKSEATWRPVTPPEAAPEGTRRRTRDEITLLYGTSFVYGAGSGAWFLLQAQPSTALTAMLPFMAITAAPVVALAIVDGHSPLPYGVPHATATGIYTGLGEGVWIVGFQHARARRFEERGGTFRGWGAEDVATVLWTSSTLGGIAGFSIASSLSTTPGRASFTASSAVWGGVLGGLAAGAILPRNAYHDEHSMLAAGIGYNGALLGGLMSAASVSPSVTRVRLVDLAGVAGGFSLGGTYLALSRSSATPGAGLGLTAAGAVVGLSLGWYLTRNMARDPSAPPPSASVSVQPTLLPLPGGAALGVAGAM